MMTDRILAIAVLAVLIAFAGVIAVLVDEIDLIIVTVVVLLFAVYDFWQQLRPGRDNDRRSAS